MSRRSPRRPPTRVFDGLFEKALLSYLTGDPVALDDLRARALTVAESIVR